VFTGDGVIKDHPKANWVDQVEHVFFDYLGRCANMMLVHEGGDTGQDRCLRFHEFDALMEKGETIDRFDPFPGIFENLTPVSKPLFWTRLVAYGNLCNDFINRTGVPIGFEKRDYQVSELLAMSQDEVITQHLADYVDRCLAVPLSAL
jgi:hypothetical protein